jgi:hypothetical protein
MRSKRRHPASMFAPNAPTRIQKLLALASDMKRETHVSEPEK